MQSALHQLKKQLYPSRQRLTLPLQNGEKKPTVLQAGKKLSDFDLADGSVVVFKDLGPQVRHHEPFFGMPYSLCSSDPVDKVTTDKVAAGCRLDGPQCSSGSTLARLCCMLSSTYFRSKSTFGTSECFFHQLWDNHSDRKQ